LTSDFPIFFGALMTYVSHPLIRERSIEQRAYQEKIFAAISSKSSMVVLPTGLGKTYIAAMLAAHTIANLGGKVLFMAPTKPLVLQHKDTFDAVMKIDRSKMVCFTGTTPPSKREEGYKDATIIFATPQVIENDIISKRLKLDDINLLIFDEAHRATGDYAYVYIAQTYNSTKKDGMVLGITASPGYDRSRIKDIIKNLGITNLHIENEDSHDVAPYVHDIKTEWVRLTFPPELEQSRALLRKVYDEKLEIVLRFRLTTKPKKYINKRDLLGFGEQLRRMLSKRPVAGEIYTGIKAQSIAIKVSHAIELLETQGPHAMLSYFEKVKKQKSKSAKEMLLDVRISRAVSLARKYENEHPKIIKLKEILQTIKEGQNAIVFSQYRDSVMQIAKALETIEGIRPIRFVGQSSRENDEGLTQKKQKEILDAFKKGAYNVLVATSVAEEGLDIPNVDLVVFFEPIPSEIRTIQRRGRTGRRRTGRLVVLIMEDTIDEAYYNVAKGKEKKMHSVLSKMGTKTAVKNDGQIKLDSFNSHNIKIICDVRENPSIIKQLAKKATIEMRTLEVGDYILSERIGIERKSTEDFLRSLFDNKLFEQVRNLRDSFKIPLLLIEGENIFTKHDANSSAVRSALLAILVDFNVGIIFSNDISESAEYLYHLARREQMEQRGTPKLRGDKRAMTLQETQVYLLEGLPNISSTLARRLLSHFVSVERVIAASEEELKEVEGIGKKTAKKIREIVSANYVR